MKVLTNRGDLINMRLMNTLNTMVKVKHPLFNEAEIIERLLSLYKVRPLVEMLNTNTVVKDNSISYVIVTDMYYILLLRKHSLRFIIRDNVNIYTDSYMKSTWSMNIKHENNCLSFNITSDACSTYLLYIKNNTVYFNRNMIPYSDSNLKRIIAVTF